MVVHSEKEAHVVRLTQQLELLVAHPERVGQIVRTPAVDWSPPTVFIGFSDNYRYIGTALILLPLGLCHCCGRLVQEDFVCVVDDVWLSSASPRRRLDPRRVSSKLTLAWRAKNMSGRMLSLQSGQANVLCLFHKIYG